MLRRQAFLRQSNEPRPVTNPSFQVEPGDFIKVRGKFRQVSGVRNAGTDQEWYLLADGGDCRTRIDHVNNFEIGPR